MRTQTQRYTGNAVTRDVLDVPTIAIPRGDTPVPVAESVSTTVPAVPTGSGDTAGQPPTRQAAIPLDHTRRQQIALSIRRRSNTTLAPC
jgi:hypothetical protein